MFVFKTIVWGTLFMLGALIAGPWVAMQFSGILPPVDIGAVRYFGVIFMAAGFIFAVYCTLLLFLPISGKPVPYDSYHKFVATGPYRYVRNPFLLGIAVVLIGESIFIAEIAMFAYTVVMMLCMHFWIVFFEEPALMDRYGDEYLSYMKRVPRWFPFLKS